MIRTIITADDPPSRSRILRIPARKVSRCDTYIQRLIADMWETMRAYGGVGLSAPQVGCSLRVLIAQAGEHKLALVNPTLEKVSVEHATDDEGCLSLPRLYVTNIERHAMVVVRGLNERGRPMRYYCGGQLARVVQHEMDHLDGVLITQRAPSPNDLKAKVLAPVGAD